MSSPPPSGIYVPVVTFFDDSSEPRSTNPPLDLDTQAKHAVYLAKSGIKGLVLLGSSGEAISFSNQERHDLIVRVKSDLLSAGFENYPLIAGTTEQSIDGVLFQLEESHKAGAQWGMVLAPGYFAPSVSQEGIALWFETVAEKSSIPILVYHYPGVSNNVNITPETMARLAKHWNIVGCKLSHGNLSHLALIASNPEVTQASFATFTGMGQLLLPVLSIGGAGAIDGLAGIFPRTVVKLFDEFEKATPGEEEELKHFQYRISAAEEVIVKWGVPGIKAGIARVLGLGNADGMRLPMRGGMPESAWPEFETAFKKISDIELALNPETLETLRLQ